MLAPMTTPRTPRPTPPSPDGTDRSGRGSSGSTRAIALVAMLVAAVALALAAWGLVGRGGSGCQQQAWQVAPKADQLPQDWTISAQQYDIDKKSMSILGPQPADQNASQAVVYATVTCFGDGAAESVTLSEQAAKDAGQTVTSRDDLGDQAYSSTDDTGAAFLQLRHGPIVVYLAASGDATSTEMDQIASAFDKALGGDGGAVSAASGQPAGSDDALASQDASGDVPSDAAASGDNASPAAPALEAALPTKVGDTALTVDSATGSTVLSDDQGSRAILAALRAEGKGPDALQLAQAYDPNQAADITITAFSVDGMKVEKLQELVESSWLASSGAGVTKGSVKLGGKDWTKIDYGDEGSIDYVRAQDGKVFVITTSDPTIAEQAAAAIR